AEPANQAARYNYELLKKYLALHPEKAAQDKSEPEQEDEQQLPPPATEQGPQPKQKPDKDGTTEAEIDVPQPDPAGEQQNGQSKGKNPQEQERPEATGNQQGDTKGQQMADQPENSPQPEQGSTENAAAGDGRARTAAEIQQVKINPEKARMLLNAMRDAELQYLQQLPKKAKRKIDKNKPDW
ncbi:MAG TPA: aerotolerance protein, partial [Pontibacter sp.]